jgi:hypothetical protein
MRICFVFLLVGFSVSPVAWGQEVLTEFSEEVFNDAFDNNRMQWEQNSNMDKLYIIGDGRYIVQRHSREADLLMNEKISALDNFDLNVALAFDNYKNKAQSAGVAFMMSEDRSRMFVLELNSSKQYRLWRKNGEEVVYFSGSGSSVWEKSSLLKPGKAGNQVEIRCDSAKYDVYFNGYLCFSFNDDQITKGRVALYVAPDSHVFFDELSVLRKAEAKVAAPQAPSKKDKEPKPSPANTPSPSNIEQQIQQLKRELEELRKQLEECCFKKA